MLQSTSKIEDFHLIFSINNVYNSPHDNRRSIIYRLKLPYDVYIATKRKLKGRITSKVIENNKASKKRTMRSPGFENPDNILHMEAKPEHYFYNSISRRIARTQPILRIHTHNCLSTCQ